MVETGTLGLLVNPLFLNIILPFLLIFVIIYAILEKTHVLGQKYVNLIVSLIIAFIFIGVQSLVGFTLRLIPVITVLIVVLLSYFLVFGFIGIGQENKGLKITLGIIFGIAIVGALLWAAGLFEKISAIKPNSDIIGLVILLVVLAGAIALVVSTKPTPKTS